MGGGTCGSRSRYLGKRTAGSPVGRWSQACGTSGDTVLSEGWNLDPISGFPRVGVGGPLAPRELSVRQSQKMSGLQDRQLVSLLVKDEAGEPESHSS